MSPAAPAPEMPMGSGLVTVFGGSGFIGRYVVGALCRRGIRVRVGVRQPHLAHHLQPLGIVGQIVPVQANVRYPDSLASACSGADAVINLVGILASAGAQKFDAVHAEGAGAVARAAKAAGARRLVQISAIGADPHSTSEYARSKAEGEARASEAFAGAIVVRPSIVFGPEDSFFNRFAAMARLSPALPLIGGGHTRFQPVYAGDVADGIARLLTLETAAGRTYEFGGPEIFTFRELMDFTLRTIQRRRLLVPVPWAVARLQGAVLQLLPGSLLTMDQVELLKSDNVVSDAAARAGLTLEGLGIAPQAIAAIVPAYLARFRRAGQFTKPTER
jgi:NADH dehydrogenase